MRRSSTTLRSSGSPLPRAYFQNVASRVREPLSISQAAVKWYGKVVTRIRVYSLSGAITYALARFQSIRTVVKTYRRMSRLGQSTDTFQSDSDLIVGPPLEETLSNIRSGAWCPGFSLKDDAVHELVNYMIVRNTSVAP